MHTFEGKHTRFHFNSDMSGEVIIRSRDGGEAFVVGRDLLDFVAEFVRRQKTSKLEEKTTEEVLGI